MGAVEPKSQTTRSSAQRTQLDELVAEGLGLYVPIGQGVPTELCAGQYIPAGHGKQLSTEVCRNMPLKVPAGQAVDAVGDGQ